MNLDNQKAIRATLPRSLHPEIIAQIVEECAESSQAALKLRRSITGDNPTPVFIDELENAMREEITDVLLCLGFVGDYEDYERIVSDEIWRIVRQREKRWESRLREKKEPAAPQRGGGRPLNPNE